MSAAQLKAITLDVFLTVLGGATGVASTLDSVEQGIRIVLGLLSIVSVTFLILVNWNKAIAQIKKWISK